MVETAFLRAAAAVANINLVLLLVFSTWIHVDPEHCGYSEYYPERSLFPVIHLKQRELIFTCLSQSSQQLRPVTP